MCVCVCVHVRMQVCVSVHAHACVCSSVHTLMTLCSKITGNNSFQETAYFCHCDVVVSVNIEPFQRTYMRQLHKEEDKKGLVIAKVSLL